MLKASAEVISTVDSPAAARMLWTRSPVAMPAPVAIPVLRPPCAVRVITSNTAGPGIRNRPKTTAMKVPRVAASIKESSRVWV